MPLAGQADLDLPAGPGRRARTVTLGLRFATMALARPNRRFGAILPDAVDMGPLRPCTDVFDTDDTLLLEAYCAKLEGKTERQKNPHPKGSLAYAAWVCARLGGWTGYHGKPGPVVMLQGWLEIQAAKRALQTLASHLNV